MNNSLTLKLFSDSKNIADTGWMCSYCWRHNCIECTNCICVSIGVPEIRTDHHTVRLCLWLPLQWITESGILSFKRSSATVQLRNEKKRQKITKTGIK